MNIGTMLTLDLIGDKIHLVYKRNELQKAYVKAYSLDEFQVRVQMILFWEKLHERLTDGTV